MTSILGIIPSRYSSTRFPSKPLVNINGKTMVQRVYEQAKKAKLLVDVIVATDNEKIYNHIISFGGKVVMTGVNTASGTDRCAEVIAKLDENYDFVINIQGDEPFIHPEQIDELASVLKPGVELATLAMKTNKLDDILNRNIVKVVLNAKNEALYFSRSPVPYIRNYVQAEWGLNHDFLRHVGIYAYRVDVLNKFGSLIPSSLELAESLEQLRWLENGYKMKVEQTQYESFGIDTPEDLEKILKSINE